MTIEAPQHKQTNGLRVQVEQEADIPLGAEPSPYWRWPWVVSFTFGLMHGFGFAGALAEVGLPQSSIPIALLFFNVGVEIGQLMFVGAVLTVIAVGWRAAQRLRLSQPVWLWRIAPYAIGSVASFWLVERVTAF